MYPYLRWLGVVLRRRSTSGRKVLEASRLAFRTWPGDLDFFGHMNNGRYLTLMDSGRWDIMAKLGLIPVLRKNHWISVIGGASIRFHKPLSPFQRFELLSRIVGWDEKWFYIEQDFVHQGSVYATAMVRGLVRAPGRSLPSAEVLAIVGWTDPSPTLPAHVREWADSQSPETWPLPAKQPV